MADLLAAARTQLRYAANELKSGDATAAASHVAKADAFLARAVHVSTLAVKAAVTPEAPLSDDPSVALHQLLALVGGENQDAAGLVGSASAEQQRELALLGAFGQPGTFKDVDYSLFEKYYEPVGAPDEENGLQSWAPKAEYQTVNIWADYLSHKP